MIARYNSRCSLCGEPVVANESDITRDGGRWVHTECSKQDARNRVAAANIGIAYRPGYANNEDAGDLSAMGAADASEISGSYDYSDDDHGPEDWEDRQARIDEMEYQQGVQDAENYRWNKAIYGEEEAERLEIEAEFNQPEGW